MEPYATEPDVPTVTIAEIAVYHGSRAALMSHQGLTPVDIQWAANFFSSFYGWSQKQPRPVGLTRDQLIMIFVYTDKRGIGEWALTWNREIDRAIQARDESYLKRLLTGPKEMLVEIYSNPYLLPEDYSHLLRLIARANYAVNLYMNDLVHRLPFVDSVVIHPGETSLSNRQICIQELVGECWAEACKCDAELCGDGEIEGCLSQFDLPPKSIYTADMIHSQPQMFCFDTMELMAAMQHQPPINPQTQMPFGPIALKFIQQRFRKELAMYRRYLS